MDVDQDTAAAAAAAAAGGGPADDAAPRTRQGTKPAAKQLGAQKLAEADVTLLDLTMEDEGLESLRRAVRDVLNVKLSQAPSTAANPLTAFAAAYLQDLIANELNKRSALMSSRVRKQTQRAKKQTATSADSPDKIKQASSVLYQPSPELAQVITDLTGMFDKAAAKAMSSDISADELSLQLDTLLATHKRRSKSRANSLDFGLHCLEARNKVISAIGAARDRKDFEQAFRLTEAMRHHETQLHSFLSVCNKVGFQAASDAYLSRANPIGGLTKEAWDMAATMSAAGEHKKLFTQLLADKFPVKPDRKKRRAEGEDTPESSSSSGDHSDTSSGPSRRKRRSSSAHRPQCLFCGNKGHWQAECRKFRDAMGQIKGGGRGNGNGYNGKGGGGGGSSRGSGKQNNGA